MARSKKPPKTTRRRAPQQEEIEGTRSVHPRIEKLAKAYASALDDLAKAYASALDDLAVLRKDVDQKKRLTLAAMQAEGVNIYRLADGKTQLRLDSKVNVKRERAARPKKRDASGKLLEVEASR